MFAGRGPRPVSPQRREGGGQSSTKLHFFDMDGTLQRGNACHDLARHVGQLEVMADIEERWVRGEVGHLEFYELCLPLWHRLTAADIEQVFNAAQWLDGLEETFADISRRGEHTVVITGSPQFFADLLRPWGVTSVHGAAVEIGCPPDPASVITPEMKVTIARDHMRRHGVTETDCVAYSDSESDIPLFRSLPYTVAVNATDALKEVAAISYDGHDLREAYAAGRSLLVGNSAGRRS